MPSYRCGSCGNVIKPIPQCHNKDMVPGEVNGIPSLICVINGENCPSKPLPTCCTMPAYSRWI